MGHLLSETLLEKIPENIEVSGHVHSSFTSAASLNKTTAPKLLYSQLPHIRAQIRDHTRLLGLDDDALLFALCDQQSLNFIAQHYNDRNRREIPVSAMEIQALIAEAEGNWNRFYLAKGLADQAVRHHYCRHLRLSLENEHRALISWGQETMELKPVTHVVVANRGEVACRVIEAGHALGKKLIVLHDGIDLSYDGLLGPEDFLYHTPSYRDTKQAGILRHDIITMAALADFLRREQIDVSNIGVHPGWGFNSEDPEWVAAVERLGFRMMGPLSEIIQYLGNKTNAVSSARSVGFTVPETSGKIIGRRALPPGQEPEKTWSEVRLTVEDFFRRAMEKGINQFLLKDAMGGGGSGQKLLYHPTMADLLVDVREYWEHFTEFSVDQYLAVTRHVEFQVLVDIHGNVRFGQERDCTLQRARQKYNEETAHLPENIREAMRDKIRAFLSLIQQRFGCPYTGAGTFEFLYCPENFNLYFMEVNTRLQVENVVSSCVDGIDYFLTQLDIVDGKRLLDQAELDQRRQEDRAYAIQARICLERIIDEEERLAISKSLKCDLESVPVGGSNVFLTRFDPALQEGVYLFSDTRLISQIRRFGRVNVPMGYDSMVAKLVATGKTPEEARGRLHQVISHFTLEGPGIDSNRELILLSLEHAHRGDEVKLARRKIADDVLGIIRGKKVWEKLSMRSSISLQEFQVLTLYENKLTAEQWEALDRFIEKYSFKEFHPDYFKIFCLWFGILNPIWRALDRYGLPLVCAKVELIIQEQMVPFLEAWLRSTTGHDPEEIIISRKTLNQKGWHKFQMKGFGND